MALRFVTDQRVEGIAALESLSTEEKAQALQDAEAVYGFLRRSEGQRDQFVPEDALRGWGEQRDMTPERMNAALAVLASDGRIFSYSEDAEGDGSYQPVEIVPEGRQAAPNDPGSPLPEDVRENDQRSEA